MAEPRKSTGKRITAATVRADFNDPVAVVHYARAAHRLGLWASERQLIERAFPDRGARLLELGCGAGRVTLGLWELGYRRLTAIDFAASPAISRPALFARASSHDANSPWPGEMHATMLPPRSCTS